jgi:hypothetical protein
LWGGGGCGLDIELAGGDGKASNGEVVDFAGDVGGDDVIIGVSEL